MFTFLFSSVLHLFSLNAWMLVRFACELLEWGYIQYLCVSSTIIIVNAHMPFRCLSLSLSPFDSAQSPIFNSNHCISRRLQLGDTNSMAWSAEKNTLLHRVIQLKIAYFNFYSSPFCRFLHLFSSIPHCVRNSSSCIRRSEVNMSMCQNVQWFVKNTCTHNEFYFVESEKMLCTTQDLSYEKVAKMITNWLSRSANDIWFFCDVTSQ